MPKIQPFELYSDDYDEWFRINADKYEAELQLIRGLLPSHEIRGMEIGVGSGRFAGPLNIEFGVEPSNVMALKAKKRGIRVVIGVAENLPVSDGVFDLVLMITTICFVDDVLESFNEAFRTLKAGGSIIVGFVDRESELGKGYEAHREQSRFYKDATFFSAEEVIGLLNKAGFRVDKIRQTLIPEDFQNAIQDGFGKGAFVAVGGLKQAEPG